MSKRILAALGMGAMLAVGNAAPPPELPNPVIRDFRVPAARQTTAFRHTPGDDFSPRRKRHHAKATRPGKARSKGKRTRSYSAKNKGRKY